MAKSVGGEDMSFQMDGFCGILKGTLGTLVLLLATEAHSADCRIAVLGDSLTASYGLDLADGFPAQLEESLFALDVAVDRALCDADRNGDIG